MGQIEKIFVIGIVLLIVIVLGVTILSRGNAPKEPQNIAATERALGTVVESAQDPLDFHALMEQARGGASPVIEARPSEVAQPTPPAPTPAAPRPAAPRPQTDYYSIIVQAGETLGQIMQRELGSAGQYLQDVLQINEGMDPNQISPDQVIWLPHKRLLQAHSQARDLRIPAPPTRVEAPAQPKVRTYTVQVKDTLWSIGRKHFPGIPGKEAVRRIEQANKGKTLAPLQIGLVLTIPSP